MATLTGTTADNTLTGTNSADSISGNGGNDSLSGRNGNDSIFGGVGNDSIDGGSGNDRLEGGIGSDTIIGGDGNDLILGGGAGGSIGGTTTVGNTFSVFSLGNFADIDPIETNGISENASSLLGTYGSNAAPIYNNIVTAVANDTNGDNTLADNDSGATPETITINGVTSAMDSTQVYDATVTFTDGSTGTFTAVVIQTANGQVYLVPEFTNNADNALLTSKPIASFTFTGVNTDNSGLVANRLDANYQVGSLDTSPDLLYGGAGNDTIDGGGGDDTIDGGTEADSIDGGDGNDSILGGTGNFADTLNGGLGDDTIRGDDGADQIFGGDGNDSLDGGLGNDIIDGGIGNDSIDGGDGADSITGGAGSDTILGGAGNDTIDGGTEADSIDGGDGNDSILGGSGNFADTLIGGLGDDTIRGDDGADQIFGGDGNDSLDGGTGNDTIDGGIGADSIDGGAGDDSITGGDGSDTILGGSGNDTIDGGAGADFLTGGADQDFFLNLTAGDIVDGSETGNDFDTLDLQSWGKALTNIIYDPLNHENGTVQFLDNLGNVIGTMTFSNIENVIPCFTPGTLIETDRGAVAVESIRVGDRVLTRDSGYRPVRWVGRRDLGKDELFHMQDLVPIRISQGAFGPDMPSRDMLVSPRHRILMTGRRAELISGETESLASALHLVGMAGIKRARDVVDVSYVHIMFDQHEIVRSDGLWTESFQPGATTLDGMQDAQRDEIYRLFPELATEMGRKAYVSARIGLKRHEVRAILAA